MGSMNYSLDHFGTLALLTSYVFFWVDEASLVVRKSKMEQKGEGQNVMLHQSADDGIFPIVVLDSSCGIVPALDSSWIGVQPF